MLLQCLVLFNQPMRYQGVRRAPSSSITRYTITASLYHPLVYQLFERLFHINQSNIPHKLVPETAV